MPFWDVFVVMQDCCSVSKSCPTLCDPMIFSTPGFSVLNYLWACSNSWPLSQWCHPAISTSVTPFSSHPQSFPVSGSFPMSRLFTSNGQNIGDLASASVLPMNIQGWFPLEFTGLISFQPNGIWKVFFSTTNWKHRFFGNQPFLWSNSHICTWLLEKP